jgi:hypothetical protein
VEAASEVPRSPTNLQYHHSTYEKALGEDEDSSKDGHQETHQPFVRQGDKVGNCFSSFYGTNTQSIIPTIEYTLQQ